MILRDAFRDAVATLRAHRLRSALTLVGMVWGTMAVLCMVAWGNGVLATVQRGIEKTGRNVGVFRPGYVGGDFVPVRDRREITFSLEDVEAVRLKANLPTHVAGEARRFLLATRGEHAMTADLRGVQPDVFALRDTPVRSGRRLIDSDVEHLRRVAVLGDTVRKRLLGENGGVGDSIRVDGVKFRVIGILPPMTGQLYWDGLSIDEQIWVPLSVLLSQWPAATASGADAVDALLYKARSRELDAATRAEIRGILAERLRIEADDQMALAVWSSAEALSRIPVTETQALMFLVGATTTLIGAIGVMSMMLDNVRERRVEIGVRLAIGAKPGDILLAFLLEALAITAIGGAIGTVLGLALTVGLGSLQLPELVPLPRVTPGLVVASFAVLVGSGVATSLVPAFQAARIPPSISLRSE